MTDSLAADPLLCRLSSGLSGKDTGRNSEIQKTCPQNASNSLATMR